jgi:hypothetical protein
MDAIDAIKKELEKYDSIREKVLRLNELDKYIAIIYGVNDVDVTIQVAFNFTATICVFYKNLSFNSTCLICKANGSVNGFHLIKSNIKNCNSIQYCMCQDCHDKNCKLCATCLRESQECSTLTKQKITFWLCTKKFTKFIIPKDIRRLITNLF